MPTITFYRRNNFGRNDIYPHGDLSDAVKTLTGRKTLVSSDVEALQALGFTLQEIVDPNPPFITIPITGGPVPVPGVVS